MNRTFSIPKWNIRNKKGLLLTAATVFFILFIFLKPYADTVVMIPSPANEAVRKLYLWVILLGCGFLLFLGGCLWIGKERPVWLFPVTLVVLGLFYMVVLAPFASPDEARHFAGAYRLSSQIMGVQAVADDAFYENATEKEREYIDRGGNVLVREQDGEEILFSQISRDTYQIVLDRFFTMDHSQGVTVRYESPVNTTPVVYLPQALGIALARLLHLGYIPLVYLGRLFNLLAFTAIACLAVSIMPFRKEVLMAVSCLPMTLNLAASMSYDTMVIALSMLLIAWCFYLAYGKKEITTKDVVVLAMILVLLEPCKIVYLPIAGICLLIPAAKFPSKKRYWISVAAVIAVMAIAVFLTNHVVLSAWVGNTDNVIVWEGTPGYTLGDVLKEPYQTFKIYYETLVTQLDYYQTTMLGGFLGNLDTDLSVPYFCLALLWIIMALSAVRVEGETAPVTWGQKAWIAVLLFLGLCLVLASMLLGWTPKGYTYITGIQGRYFLPYLPLLLLLVFDRNLVLKKDLGKGLFYLEGFVNIYALIRICSMTVVR